MTTPNQTNPVQPIPDGYTTVTPWIIVKGAAKFLDYLKAAFDAEELARVPSEDGSIGHAEARIGNAIVMTFDAKDSWIATPAFMRLYVEDSDAVFKKAIAAGGSAVTEMTALSFGDRVGRIRDPWGNVWWIQERVEAVSLEEMEKRVGDKAYNDAMAYLQNSLTEALRRPTSE